MLCVTRYMYVVWLNPFPHKDTFWRLCSRRLFENRATKEEIAQDEQFILFATMFSTFSHRLSIQIKRFSIFITTYVQSHLLQNCCMGERVNTIYSIIFYSYSLTIVASGKIMSQSSLKIYKTYFEFHWNPLWKSEMQTQHILSLTLLQSI